METASFCVLIKFVIITIASAEYNNGFHFYNSWFRRWTEEDCMMCYEDENCVTLDQARCELYAVTYKILYEDDISQDLGPSELRREVDDLMNDLVTHATTDGFKNCIPLISQYTNCAKDNVCLECVNCNCNEEGSWNCSSMHHCHPHQRLQGHPSIAYALETFREEKQDRENVILFENYTSYENVKNISRGVTITSNSTDNNLKSRDKETTAVTEENADGSVVVTVIDDGYSLFNGVVKDKQQELQYLLKMRQRLIDILKHNKSVDFSVTNETDTESFNNMIVLPEIEFITKRYNPSNLDKYIQKLRHDILVVMKDLAVMQRLTNIHNMPKELKNLIHAMQQYMRNKQNNINNQNQTNKIKSLRKYSARYSGKDFVRKYFIELLQILYINMTQSDTLAPLSATTRKIIKRIYKTNYINEKDLKVNDSYYEYDLTNYLKTIAVTWQEMTDELPNNFIWNRIDHMKMIHFTLDSDINKLNSALELIDFAVNGKMVVTDATDNEILRINANLISIHDRIKKIITSTTNNINITKEINDVNRIVDNKPQTASVLKNICNFINCTKNFFANVHKNVKRNVKAITNKIKTKFESIIGDWKKDFYECGRRKRSAYNFEHVQKHNMRSILPKYLRGKIPKLNKTRTKNKSHKQNKNLSGILNKNLNQRN